MKQKKKYCQHKWVFDYSLNNGDIFTDFYFMCSKCNRRGYKTWTDAPNANMSFFLHLRMYTRIEQNEK